MPQLKNCTRMSCWLAVSVILIAAVGWLVPGQMPVILNKLLLVSLAAWVGYWISVSVFPSARPGHLLYLLDHTSTDGLPPNEWELLLGRITCSSMVCRAAIMSAAMVAVALGI